MESKTHIHRHSSPEDKVALFRSLFRGRDDVYPRRFESRKTGRSGYAPACANEWVRGICEKPNLTAPSIWPTRGHIAAIGERTTYSKSTAISFCVSWPKMLASIWTR